ncbi:hypothetical protein, partial [Bradyrhizobium sp. WSM2254]|uniref:hypothetical protein n=1 Tax=Bradyrhizobium sp. WSM2254 TaxID=1188263 RepID=UPI001AEBB90C
MGILTDGSGSTLIPLPTSSWRRPGGGFTLEVQQLRGEGLCRGSEVKAFARGVVVGGNGLAEALGWELFEVGLSGDEAAQAADGVLDAALLPRRVGVAEEGL